MPTIVSDLEDAMQRALMLATSDQTWKQLGYASEQEWIAAGKPNTPKPAPLFTSSILAPAQKYGPPAPPEDQSGEAALQQGLAQYSAADFGAPGGSNAPGNAPLPERITQDASTSPFVDQGAEGTLRGQLEAQRQGSYNSLDPFTVAKDVGKATVEHPEAALQAGQLLTLPFALPAGGAEGVAEGGAGLNSVRLPGILKNLGNLGMLTGEGAVASQAAGEGANAAGAPEEVTRTAGFAPYVFGDEGSLLSKLATLGLTGIGGEASARLGGPRLAGEIIAPAAPGLALGAKDAITKAVTGNADEAAGAASKNIVSRITGEGDNVAKNAAEAATASAAASQAPAAVSEAAGGRQLAADLKAGGGLTKRTYGIGFDGPKLDVEFRSMGDQVVATTSDGRQFVGTAQEVSNAAEAAGRDFQKGTTSALAPSSVAVAEPPAPEPPQLPDLGTSGIDRAIAAKEATTLEPGRLFGDQGSIQRKVVGAANPSVDLPRDIHVRNQARLAVQASEQTQFARPYVSAADSVDQAFSEAKPKYIGPADNPFKNLPGDYLQNPRFYEGATPQLEAAKSQWQQAGLDNLSRARSEYGVDINEFRPKDPSGVYVPDFKARDVNTPPPIERTTSSLSSNPSIVKERTYDSWYDRWKQNPDYQPVTDLREVADTHSRQLASAAANNTFKTGIGLNRADVLAQTHPELSRAMTNLRARLNNLRATLSRVDVRGSQAIDTFLRSPQEADDLTALQDALSRARVGKNAVGLAGPNFGKTAEQIRADIATTKAAIAKLRPAWRTADLGDYVFSPETYRYHTPEEARAINSVLKRSPSDNAFIQGTLNAADTARAAALGPDFSPLTIQGSLGAFSHPEVTIKNGLSFAKAAFTGDKSFYKSLDPELVRRFEFATGRKFGQLGEEFSLGSRGVSLPGQPIKKFNDALNRMVDLGVIKAFENDSNIVKRLTGASQDVADAEAAHSLGEFIPRLDLAGTARSTARGKMERFALTSISYTAQPFNFAKDFGAALVKAGTLRPSELTGRETLALLRGSTFMGTIAALSVGSALLSAKANNLSPSDAVKEVIDPNSGRFMSLILGNKGSVGLGGPFRSAFLGAYRTLTQGPSGAAKYARGRLNVPVGNAFDVLVNRDWKGNPIRTGSGWHQVQQTLAYLASQANITASGVIEGAKTGGLNDAVFGGLSQFSGQNFYERTSFDRADSAVRAAVASGDLPSRYTDANGQDRPVRSLNDLKAASPEAYDQFLKDHKDLADATLADRSDTTKAATQLKQDAYDQQEVRDETLLNTDPAAWRSQSGDANKVLGAKLDQLYTDAYGPDGNQDPKNLLELAQQQYHEAIVNATDTTGNVDWDQVDEALATMSPKMQDLLFQSRLSGETPARQQYIRDLRDLVPYFNARDEAWQKLAATDPEASQYKTFDAYLQAQAAKIRSEKGVSWTEAQNLATKRFGFVQDEISQASDSYLNKNAEELLPLLDKYGYYIPKKYQSLVGTQTGP